VDVRVMGERRAPAVQHRSEADLRADDWDRGPSAHGLVPWGLS
jgi:hypothetical protein